MKPRLAEYQERRYVARYIGPRTAPPGEKIFLKYLRRSAKYFEKYPWAVPRTLRERGIVGLQLPAKSSHGIFYTRVEPAVPGKQPLHLVVKPYKGVSRLETEFHNLLEAERRGIAAVEPLGYIYDPKTNTSYLYTKAKFAAIPLSAAKEFKEQERAEVLRELGRTLRGWHTVQHFFHRDPKLKNFLYAVRAGLPRLATVDLEKGKFQTKAAFQDRVYDVATLVGDAIHHGLIRNYADLEAFVREYAGAEEAAFMAALRAAPAAHPKDKNIQNIRKIPELYVKPLF